MKLKKVTLYYREMKDWLDMANYELEGKNVIIFKTTEGGFGIRQQCHGWKPGDKVWTANGLNPSTVIAVASHKVIKELLNVFSRATYMVNRFISETERKVFLSEMEEELLNIAAR